MAKPGKPQQGSAVKVVEALVRPVVEGMNLRLWDVRFEKEGPDWFLRVLIDRDEPLDTDTCEAVSRGIDPLLDEADPIEQSYYLEVGSPGLGRRLTRPEHYEQLKGQKCAAHLARGFPANSILPFCAGPDMSGPYGGKPFKGTARERL